MIRAIAVLVVVLGLCSLAGAQVLGYAEVRAKNGTQLSAADLNQLMPGAKVISRTAAGSTRSWQNKPDGTFIAQTDSRGTMGGRNVQLTSQGTWRVTEGGRLCVKIQWPTNQDDWCRFIFKAGNLYYGFSKLDDSAQGMEFEFSK
jgi:hypothetical protein